MDNYQGYTYYMAQEGHNEKCADKIRGEFPGIRVMSAAEAGMDPGIVTGPDKTATDKIAERAQELAKACH